MHWPKKNGSYHATLFGLRCQITQLRPRRWLVNVENEHRVNYLPTLRQAKQEATVMAYCASTPGVYLRRIGGVLRATKPVYYTRHRVVVVKTQVRSYRAVPVPEVRP